MRPFLFSVSFAALTAAGIAQAETQDVIVVMDASGSMWGQIDGVSKIEIAREVFADVSQDWGTQDIAAGLIAYGHRRKGDCGDIEVIAPVDASSTAQLGALVNGLMPRGKTPLSDAVRLAAQEMKFTEQAATVVLLTDGIETCNADPCALGAELEQLGVDFTTHVIGFDITNTADKAQLQCLASSTGGLYLDSGDAGALGDALRQVTQAVPAEEAALGTYGIVLSLDYQDSTVRPQTVRFQARNPDSGTILDLGTLTGTVEIITGLETDLEEGDWLIEAISDEGYGALNITHTDAQILSVPFAALPVRATIQDGSPYQLGTEITVQLDASGFQENAELRIALYDMAGQALDWETRFGSDGDGISVHSLVSPETPGPYRIVLGDLDDPLAELPVVFSADAQPEWRGTRRGAVGGTIPTHIAGNTYYYNSLILSQDGTEISSQQLGYEGAPLQLPDQPGVYDLSYSYSDANDVRQIADLGQIQVDDGPTQALPDDADAVQAPSQQGAAAIETPADTDHAMNADDHGWVPSSPAASADAALLRDVAAENVVFSCRAEQCFYDDPATGFTGIPILGDFALLRPEQLERGEAFVEMVNEVNGEWVVLNPIMQSDMVTDCVGFGTEGWHSLSDAPVTDLACTVAGGNGYTFMQMEALADWASARNAANEAAAQQTHNATMGEDGPGLRSGPLQDNWIVTDLNTGEELMQWQILQDDGAGDAYLDLIGRPGTAFAALAESMSAAPSITIVGTPTAVGPEAFQVNKPLKQGTLVGMFTRPGDWDGVEDSYTGMVQLSAGETPVIKMIKLTRAAD